MKKDKNVHEDIKARVKVNNIFPNLIATKNLDLNKFKFVGKNYKKTFESDIETTLQGTTLFALFLYFPQQ